MAPVAGVAASLCLVLAGALVFVDGELGMAVSRFVGSWMFLFASVVGLYNLSVSRG